MQNKPLTIVISQGQSRNPEKRGLEDSLASEAAALESVEVLVVPNLYDLSPQGETIVKLKQVAGPIVVISWLYDRAAHWTLDRVGIRGQMGEVQLKHLDGEDEEEDSAEPASESSDRVSGNFPRPTRPIYSIDFRASHSVEAFIAEISRIQVESREFNEQLIGAAPLNTSLAEDGSGQLQSVSADASLSPKVFGVGAVQAIDEHPGRRWYPVIDYSRCTNCMECIDFCLFGVYGVDSAETILVEQPDNCRKGCPACSRVCPSNAIMFPQHKTPAIAGAPVDAGGLKIDLSKLFGAPDRNEDPITAAARERDEQLILAGRQALGARGNPGNSKVLREKSGVKDDFDSLLDQLDKLDL